VGPMVFEGLENEADVVHGSANGTMFLSISKAKVQI